MWMSDYIREIQRLLISQYGFAARSDNPGIPSGVPDGEYPMMIDGKMDHVQIRHGKISCCNFTFGKD